MGMRWVRAAWPGAVCLAALGCSADDTSGAREPLKIGIILDLSGEVGDFTRVLLNSAQLAVDELNASGGLGDGRPLVLVPGNTNGVREGAVTATERLSDEDGVLGLTGFDSSGEALPVVPVAAERGVSMVSCCATSDALTVAEEPVDRHFFRTVPPDSLQAPILAGAARNAGCTTLGSFHTDDAYGAPLAQSLEAEFEALDGESLFRIGIDADAASFREEVRQGAAEAPDCVALLGFPTELGILRRDWDDQGGPDVQWLASDGAFSDQFIERTVTDPTLWQGLIVSTPELSPESPRQRTYRESYELSFGQPPGPFGAQQYDAAAILALAVARVASQDDEVTPEKVRDSLYEVTRPGDGKIVVSPGSLQDALLAFEDDLEVDYQGATGAVDLDDCGNVVADYALYEFVPESEQFELFERITVDVGAPCPPE